MTRRSAPPRACLVLSINAQGDNTFTSPDKYIIVEYAYNLTLIRHYVLERKHTATLAFVTKREVRYLSVLSL